MRADGWQCYAPEGGYYDGELVPPVADIAAETGGPVLGIGVARSDHYRVCFIDQGELRTIANGWYHEFEQEQFEREVVARWGDPWRVNAAAGLRRWAEPITNVSVIALLAVLSVPRIFAERTVFDLLELLTLVEDPAETPWWRQIPGAVYAVEVSEISSASRHELPPEAHRQGAVLGFTHEGGRHMEPRQLPLGVPAVEPVQTCPTTSRRASVCPAVTPMG